MTEDPSSAPRAGVEAAKLLAVAQEWLRTSAPHLAPVDADGQTCPCPLCRAVAGVREADPDAVGRWVDSAVAAATAVLAQASEKAAAYADPSGAAGADAPERGADPGGDGYLDEDDEVPVTGDRQDGDGRDETDDRDEEDGPTADGAAGSGRGVRRIPIVEQDGDGDA